MLILDYKKCLFYEVEFEHVFILDTSRLSIFVKIHFFFATTIRSWSIFNQKWQKSVLFVLAFKKMETLDQTDDFVDRLQEI